MSDVLLTEVEGDDFTAKVARYFLDRPNQWIDAYQLTHVGGTYAWRTRISDARKRYSLTITNRWRHMYTHAGQRYRISEYRLEA